MWVSEVDPLKKAKPKADFLNRGPGNPDKTTPTKSVDPRPPNQESGRRGRISTLDTNPTETQIFGRIVYFGYPETRIRQYRSKSQIYCPSILPIWGNGRFLWARPNTTFSFFANFRIPKVQRLPKVPSRLPKVQRHPNFRIIPSTLPSRLPKVQCQKVN